MKETDVNLNPEATSSSRWRRWAWLPLPLLLVTIVGLWAADLRTEYPSPYLQMLLNFLTRTLACLAIAYVAGRSFLDRGTPGLLLLGCGVAIWGTAGFVASAVTIRDANLSVTISNLGAWLSALCQLAGVALSIQAKQTVRAPRLWLTAAYALALALVGLVTVGTFAGWLPVFFIQGQGGTMVREFVLCSAIAMFVLAAFLLRVENRSSASSFAHWYTWALFVIATGLFGVMIESSRNTALDWTCRIAQYLGGVYMLIAAFAFRRASEGKRTLTLGETPDETHYRYPVAIGIVLAATAVRLAFLQMLGTRVTYITFYPAVMLAALYGGLGPGLLATAISALLANYLWLEPAGQLFVGDFADWLGMAIFIVSCTLISCVTEALRRAQARVREAEVRAQYASDPRRAEHALRERERRFAVEKLKAVFPVRTAFAVALVMLTTITWFSYRNTMIMVESDRWENHCYVVVQELDRFISALADAESGQRGFLITGNEKYLEPYHHALDVVGERLESLKRLTQDTPQDQAWLQQIEPLLNQKLVDLKQTIEVRRTKGFDAATPAVTANTGKELMDEIRKRVGDFQQDEARVLQEHMVKKVADTRSVIQSVFVGGLLSFVLLVAIFVLLRKEIAQRIRAESEVLAHRDHLEEKVLARTAELEREASERKRAEAALRHERDFSTAVLDTAGALIFVVDVEGRITQFNRACEALTGYREIEVLGRVFWEFLIPTEELLGVRETWSALQAGVFANTHENYWLAKDSSRHLIAWSNTAIVSSAGATEYIISTGVDVTERNRAEEALRQSETIHRVVADNTYNWEFWRDPLGQFLYCSPSCERVTGYKAAEFMAHPGLRHRLIHPDDRASFDRHCCEIEEGRKFGKGEWRFLLPDGTWRWVAHVCQPVYDASGNFLGTRGSNRDITERKRAEEALEATRHSLERERDLLQTVMNEAKKSHLVFLDRDFNFVRVNETYAHTCGYTPEQMIGKNHFVLYPHAENEAIFARVRDTGEPAEYHDKLFEFPDQPERGVTYWDWTLNPVNDSAGHVVGLIFSLFETTARKRAEEELLRARADLEVRVQERTAELQASNKLFQAAIRGWRTLSACNEALVRATNETELLEQICRVIVDLGGYRMAWVGLAEHDKRKTVRPVAKRGFDDGYLDNANITWDDSPQGRGPTGTAIRDGQVIVNRNFMADPHLSPWRDDAIKHGYASSVALPLLSDGGCLGALTIYAAETEAFSAGELELLRELASDMSFGIVTLRTRAERERLQVEFLRVSEREQQRIGQDLHDNLGQQLTGIAYLSEALERRLSTRAPAEASAASRIAKLLGNAIGEARSLAHGLNPLHLHGNGLMLSLQELARRMSAADHVSCRFICHGPVLVHDNTVALHLFRIAQEAVNNALKHGRARHVTIRLNEGPSADRAILYVQDDGCGLPKKPQKTTGIGLATMQHRAVTIGGILEIRAAEPRGTIVECSFPNPEPRHQQEPQVVEMVRAEKRTKPRRERTVLPVQQSPGAFKPLGRRAPR